MHQKHPITDENKSAIDAYINYEQSKNYKTTTLKNHRNYLNMIFKSTKKSWKNLNHIDIITIINQFENPRTREVIKNTLRKFLIHQKRKKLAQLIEFNSKILNTPIKGDEAKLTPEEITQMIETPNDLVHKSLIETFIVTGARESEIAQLTIGDVYIKPDTIWIHIRYPKGNSPPRRIPIVPNILNPVALYPRNLVQWIQYRKNLSSVDPLFIAKKAGKAMTKSGIYHIIKKLGKIYKTKMSPHTYCVTLVHPMMAST